MSGASWTRWFGEEVFAAKLRQLGTRFVPFADAATDELPLGRLLRLGLFQVSVGMGMALLNGTLNRVMILELGVPAVFVALLVSLPLVFAPLRTLIGHRSDVHRSVLGWRRVPYMWMGTMLQFGGLAIMPFALILLRGSHTGSLVPGVVGATLAFLMVGAGIHTTQTAGLALATDLAPAEARPRVVALLYLMLLGGTLLSAYGLGTWLADYTHTRLTQVVQSASVLALVLNVVALWKQEPRGLPVAEQPPFAARWREFLAVPRAVRLLVALALGTAGFAMQDVLLEPFGGEILAMSVGATTHLTALMAAGSLLAFALAARRITGGSDPLRLAAAGSVGGAFAFVAILFSVPLLSRDLFRAGTFAIGFSGALFSVGTLTAAMHFGRAELRGLALGAWGAVQALAAGSAVALGGLLRDAVAALAERGLLGPAMTGRGSGYVTVYLLEVVLLFVAVVALGPLVGRFGARRPAGADPRFGLAELPG